MPRLLGSPRRLPVAGAALLAALLGAGACALFSGGYEEPPPVESAIFPPRIESVAMPPVRIAPGVRMNPADGQFFHDQVSQRFLAHPPLTVYGEPPDELPGVASVEIEFTRYGVDELYGEQLWVRTVDMGVRMLVGFQASEDAPVELHRAYSFQKVYLAAEAGATALFDVQTAMMEFANLIERLFFPPEFGESLEVAYPVDPDTDDDLANGRLARANRFAESGLSRQAIRLWELSLYSPDDPEAEDLYKLTRRGLNQLAEEAVLEEVLTALEPLTSLVPRDYVAFRSEVRQALQAASPIETRILELSRLRTNQAHYNLAAAHLNLARHYNRELQLDLASYHYAMSFAHDPRPGPLGNWHRIQLSRNLITDQIDRRTAVRLYLSVPPPTTARHLPGDFDLAVLPASSLRDEGLRQRIARIVARSAPGGAVEPLELQIDPVPVEELLLPPLEPEPPPPAAPPAQREAIRPQDSAPIVIEPDGGIGPQEGQDIGGSELPPIEAVPLEPVPLEPEAQ